MRSNHLLKTEYTTIINAPDIKDITDTFVIIPFIRKMDKSIRNTETSTKTSSGVYLNPSVVVKG